MEKSVAERIGRFCLSLDYEAIPPKVREKVKDHLLDTLGICVRSATLDSGRIMLDLMQSWGGAPESSLIGAELEIGVQNAAFANGVLAHGLDYDDTHTESVVHPSACLAPVALAVGEKTGCSGREVLTALTAGLEMMIRLGLPALNRFHMRGFHTTSICGTFAAAATAGKLMGLDPAGLCNALGICGSFTSGLLECVSFGSWAKQLHAGWAGLCGIAAAQLAQKSFTGPLSIFEGRLGLYNSFLRSEPLDLNVIFDGIGEKWEILNIRPKLYPCCHYLQAFLDCAAFLRAQNAFDKEKIQKIVCRVSEGAANIICIPWEKKLAPASAYDLKFSLPYAVAVMLSRGKAGFSEFSSIATRDMEVGGLMEKVSYEIEPGFTVKDMPGAIRIGLEGGTCLEHCIDQVRGDAGHPIGREELVEKFRDNCLPSLGMEKTAVAAALILNFEQQRNVNELMRQLAGATDK